MLKFPYVDRRQRSDPNGRSIANGSSLQVHELGRAKIVLVETLQHLSVAFQILVKIMSLYN